MTDRVATTRSKWVKGPGGRQRLPRLKSLSRRRKRTEERHTGSGLEPCTPDCPGCMFEARQIQELMALDPFGNQSEVERRMIRR